MVSNSFIPDGWSQELYQKGKDVLLQGRMSQIRTVLKTVRFLPHKLRGREFKLGITHTFTVETQVDAINLAGCMIPCDLKVKFANLDNIEQTLLDSKSELHAWKPDAFLVLWRLDELLPFLAENPYALSVEERVEAISSVKSRIQALIDGYTKMCSAPLLISTLPLPALIEFQEIHCSSGIRRAVNEINAQIFKCSYENSSVLIFDLSHWSAKMGSMAYDRKFDLFARQPISAQAIGSFSMFLARTIRPFILASSKVLALDLDNVLWGGVLGEDGISNLMIDHGYPGNIYRRIQQLVLGYKKKGILLVLLSKNNFEDVENAFSELDEMPLKLSDFTIVQANWSEKYINLIEISKNLNLGLDSFVFVDDQPFEQEQMRFNLSEVKVLNVTEDPLTILDALEECCLFDQHRISESDLIRNKDYLSQASRKKLEKSSESSEHFLHTLKLVADISTPKENQLNRAHQMMSKTNQFNVTTRRHSEAQIRSFLNNQDNILLTLSLSDRFGKQGIIGMIIALMENDTTMKIDSFLLSCRAIGRGAELALWASFLDKAKKKGVNSIEAEYIRTNKNAQVSNLFDKLGMIPTEGDENLTRYKLDFPIEITFPNWITIKQT
jgi:FkbH-like protein